MSTTKTLTVNEVASILRISRTKAYQLVNSNEFGVVRIGKAVRVLTDSFENWIRNQHKNS